MIASITPIGSGVNRRGVTTAGRRLSAVDARCERMGSERERKRAASCDVTDC